MTVGITGATGQLGFHTRCRLGHHDGYQVAVVDRKGFANPEQLARFVAESDVVVHLAAINRGTDTEVGEGNRWLADQLAAAIRRSESAPGHVIYVSSTQCDRDNVYGRAKRAAGHRLRSVTEARDGRFLELVLPNLFGEYTRPYYNSFVATFCHQVAAGRPLSIHGDNPVSLLHYGEVAAIIADSIASGAHGSVRPAGLDTSVVAVADQLVAMHGDYARGIVPDLRDRFRLQLFNSYRSCLFPDFYPFTLELMSDPRGSLVECIKERNGGQAFYSSTRPGVTRGNHFHFDKVERFLVVSGSARISIRRLYDDKVQHFDVSGGRPAFIDMPTLHTHSITNTGSDDLLTLFWAHELFDPNHADTYPEVV